ncbi:ankyrin repeat domain-containing protein [Horticoccus sp. 23ND18S-11]|uniref:ankyrin repeat domain-containing protein n=1 Tax=Horticoccus sp. 23ND18S-11 TaxID=3391832 RepID=UPI0039C9F81F
MNFLGPRPPSVARWRMRPGAVAVRQTLMLGCLWALAPGAVLAANARLADAIEKQDVAAVRALIGDSDVNAAQVDGMTALHWAVQHDDLATARTLIAARANPQAENRYGVTPLSIACTNGNAAMVTLVLEAGADPNAALRGGETPLMTAARTGRLDAVKALLARGAAVNARLPQGQTALMWAAADGHTAVVEALLEAGAEFRTPLASGFSPMLFAVRSGHTAIVRALLKAGADINETAQPARNAAKYLRKGASALTTAIENGHFELAALLVDLGADPGDLRSGYSPLHILCWIRKPDRGEDEGDPVPEGSGRLTSDQLIRKLVAKGADVNARLTGGPSGGGRIARKGCTPFMMAADTADTAYLRLLKELGADPNLTNVDGCTPLMAAAGLGTRSAEEEAGTDEEAVEAVAYLLSLGADVNAVSDQGDTGMHGAAFANFPKVVKFLDTKGAKIEVWNQKNKRGWTPLLIAEGHRYGNFKPSFETIAAIKEVMIAHGVTPPPPTPPVAVKGYEQR